MNATSPTMMLVAARQADLRACARSCRPAGVSRSTRRPGLPVLAIRSAWAAISSRATGRHHAERLAAAR